MDSRYNLPFSEDSIMKGLLSDLIHTLKNTYPTQSEAHDADISKTLEKQSEIISRITEEKLQKFDPMQLDSIESEILGCQELLHNMMQDIQRHIDTKLRLVEEKTPSITAEQDPFEKVQGYLQKQNEALDVIRDKIILARVLRNAKELENIQAPLFADPNITFDPDALRITLNNYFLSMEADFERSYVREKARKEFVKIAKLRQHVWPESVQSRYLKELESFLSQ
jgi:hypothetical protein